VGQTTDKVSFVRPMIRGGIFPATSLHAFANFFM